MTENPIPKDISMLLLSPNLGHPLILKVDSKNINQPFLIDLLFATSLTNQDEIKEYLTDAISFLPILEYSWKIQRLLEEIKMDWLYSLIEKKRESLWKKMKDFFLKKKRKLKEQELLKKPLEFIDSIGNIFHFPEKNRYRPVKPKPFRGKEIQAIVVNVESSNVCDLDDKNFDNYYSPRNYLVKQDILGPLGNFFKISIQLNISSEIQEFLLSHNFIMFDIRLKFPTSCEKINYHSIVFSKNDWNDIKIVQATDLHLAERNDRIYEIVKNWTSMVRKTDIGEILSEGAKTLNFFQRLFIPKSKRIPKAQPTIPLKKRYINPNNNFRTFIKLMNKQVLNNEIDFVVLTGDLIDYAILSKLPKEMRTLVDFEYERSNWKVFKEIVLNFPQEKKRGMVKGEELLCPIFTIPGNHEYRPFHYDIRWGGLFRKIGLNANEALALNDELMANPISSITKSFLALKTYLREVNSSLDYFLKLGQINLIFLNSGADSFKKIMDFVSGHPSLTGLSSKQIKYLENLARNRIHEGDLTLLFIHGPPINSKNTISIFKRFGLPKHEDEVLTKIDEYMESRVLMLGKDLSTARIDEKFDIKYGITASNWESLMSFCKKYCTLTLSGHTHQLNEFRLGNIENDHSEQNLPSFNPLEKGISPAAVYYDNYSEMYTNPKEIEQHGPFIVQTPALGLGSYFNPKLSGAYREIEIKNRKLTSFKVKLIPK